MTPLRFAGGSIGDLAVNGTVNDLAVAGATPLALAAAFVLEEGLPVATLRDVVADMAAAAARAGVAVVTGDTKVVGRGAAGACSSRRPGSVRHASLAAATAQLAADLAAELGRRGLRVLAPERVPAHDGGISIGQAAVAAAITDGDDVLR